MKLSVTLTHRTDAETMARWAATMESAGVDVLWAGEAYGFDAVSTLGYLAAKTTTIGLGSAILPIYSRAPALIAMTAAGLDFVSSGRFILGLGASGPQVVEGWFGVPYDRPLLWTRETMEVCRSVWARERLQFRGRAVSVPLVRQGGIDPKPLKLLDHPLRADIPIYLAALGPKNVELAAELAQGWLPFFFNPERADLWANAVARGTAKRSSELGPLEVVAGGPVALCGEDLATQIQDAERPHVALYVGGMGSAGHNFYNELFVRYGYEKEAAQIQELYLSGRRKEAEALVPFEYLKSTSMVGDAGHIHDRIAAYRAAGVTCLNVDIHESNENPVELIEKLRTWSEG